MYDVSTEVKTALKDGGYKKNYRFDVYEEVEQREIFTIDNDTLVSESVSFDERMNSGKNLKFGLCEGTSLEFQYFNHPNINGRTLKAFVDVQYPHTVPGEKVPLFSVDLQGDAPYTFEESKNYYMRFFNDSETAVKIWITDENEQFIDGILLSSHEYNEITVRIPADGQMTAIPSTAGTVVNVSTQVYEQLPDTKVLSWQTIPMGTFTVDEVSRQASTGIMKATAYNKLMSDYLDSKANSSIVEIVANGEPGISDGVTYYYLLNKLLEGYAIDNRADDLVQVNISGEDTSHVDNHGGNTNVGIEYAAFRVYKQNNYTSDIQTLGLYIFKRKVVTVNTRPEKDAHSSYCSVMIPKEYNRVTFSSNVAKDLRIGFNEVFGEYISESLNDKDYTYYIQPVFSRTHIDWSHIDDSGYFDYAGTAYELNEVLNSQEEIWPITFIGHAYSGYDTHIDSSLKGMVVLDNDNNGGAFSMYPHVELKSSGGSRDFFFKQFITPTNADSSDYFWVELNTSSGGCNCADLILPTEVYYLKRRKDYYSLGYEYPWNNNQDYNFGLEIKHKTISDIEKMRILQAQAESFADITLRELQSAVYEMNCQYGQLDRETDLFSGVELSQGASVETISKDMYSKLWADEGNICKWKYLIITYKGLDGEGNEKEYTLQRTVNSDGTDNYNMSDNWIFRNLVWTAAQVGEYADAMVQKMQNITWFPFEAWTAGLPYVETGDKVMIPLGVETYTSYILQRTLKGIQNLEDTYVNGELDIF